MPGGGGAMGTSPGLNRGGATAYKVPSKRGPLQDVSNQNQRGEGGEPEAKKQRIEGGAGSGQGTGVGAENAGPGVVGS